MVNKASLKGSIITENMLLVEPLTLSPQSPSSSPHQKKTQVKKKIVGSYVLGKTLGKGSYSTVKRAHHIETQTEVAIKILTPGNRCDMVDIEREIAILKLLRHPNIINLLDVIQEGDGSKMYLVFELVNGGDLFDYTIARGRLSEREARRIMREVVSAVAYCHAHMVVHRDLKLENLLMDKDGHARIADFGMSGIMQPGLRMNTFCGSPMYMSPEIVQGLGYGPGVDVWSLGVVLYTILVGRTPWRMSKTANDMVEDLDSMLEGKFTIPSDIKLSPDCEELLNLMIVPEHAKRATIEQLMDHPWLKEGYGQPVTVPLSVSPITEVNEVVVKRMLNMGFTEEQTRKALSQELPSPARMVYQHLLTQLEEGTEGMQPPLVPASPRRHTRHSSISPRNGSVSGSQGSRGNSTVGARKMFPGPARARAVSDMSLKSPNSFLRSSAELPASSSSCSNIPYVSHKRGSFSAGQAPPLSPRTAFVSSWRQGGMSTISEEDKPPVGGIATEMPGQAPRVFNKQLLPTLLVSTPAFTSSAPVSPTAVPVPITSSISSSAHILTSHAPLLSPISPLTSPSSVPFSPSTEGLVVVRGAFNVATTTLKPRRVLLAELSRVLAEANISYALSHSVFKCKMADRDDVAATAKENEKTGQATKGDAMEDETEEMEEGEVRLKFEVEVCRVAGMEMLLGVRFQRVIGKQEEYQEMCKKLMASMKL